MRVAEVDAVDPRRRDLGDGGVMRRRGGDAAGRDGARRDECGGGSEQGRWAERAHGAQANARAGRQYTSAASMDIRSQNPPGCLTSRAWRAPSVQPKKGGGMYISIGAAILIIILLIIFVF